MSDKSTFLAALKPGVYLTRLPKSKRDKKTERRTAKVCKKPWREQSTSSHCLYVSFLDDNGKESSWVTNRIPYTNTVRPALDDPRDWELLNMAGVVIARFRITSTPDGEHPKEDRYSWMK